MELYPPPGDYANGKFGRRRTSALHRFQLVRKMLDELVQPRTDCKAFTPSLTASRTHSRAQALWKSALCSTTIGDLQSRLGKLDRLKPAPANGVASPPTPPKFEPRKPGRERNRSVNSLPGARERVREFWPRFAATGKVPFGPRSIAFELESFGQPTRIAESRWRQGHQCKRPRAETLGRSR